MLSSLVVLLATPSSAQGIDWLDLIDALQGDCYGPAFDNPGCLLVPDQDPWDPRGPSILAVADQTVGIQEVGGQRWSGQSYWNVQLHVNDRALADFYASLDETGDGTQEPREAWCSETVSYWHHQAGLPYPDGYETAWHPSERVSSVKALREWYEATEEREERGRWIGSSELDLDDFRPGVNAPCPGAYQAIRQLKEGAGGKWGSGAHSQVVSAMTVQRDWSTRRIAAIQMQVIDGNGGARDIRYQDMGDILRRLPQSPDAESDRRVEGWGIDLDARREPLCDMGAISEEWVNTPVPDLGRPTIAPTSDGALRWVGFADALDAQGVVVASPSAVERIPTLPGVDGTPAFALRDADFIDGVAVLRLTLPETYPADVGTVWLRVDGRAITELGVRLLDDRGEAIGDGATVLPLATNLDPRLELPVGLAAPVAPRVLEIVVHRERAAGEVWVTDVELQPVDRKSGDHAG